MEKIALITPLKNEIENIDRLLVSINQQSIKICCWIIVENDSDDGSQEKLDSVHRLSNIDHFNVISMQFEDKEYKLGTKYATIVNYGFEFLKKQPYYNDLNYIGILDSDCFPETDYYKKLTIFMAKENTLGISSGLTVMENGKADMRNKNWVRGNCRLWKKKCFDDSGYIIGPSADTLSVCKAILKGWKVYPDKNIFVTTRDLGDRVNFKYYGSSAYYRGHTLVYVILKSIVLFFKGKRKASLQFYQGFATNYFSKAERIKDNEILRFYNMYMINKVINVFKK